MNRKSRLALWIGVLTLLVSSCMGIPRTDEVRRVDALNSQAAQFYYISLDSVHHYALQAYQEAHHFELGKAEACNNLGFYSFMKMDFEGAMQQYKEVYDHTINELELLISDVGIMKICQRTAQNKLFYDYRNRALARMKRINEDRSVFDTAKDKQRLDYAFSEFHLVSVIYYYYLQQTEAAQESMHALEKLKSEGLALNPTYASLGQLLYYRYIKGSTETITGRDATDRMLNSFEELYQAWRLAHRAGIFYVEANAAQGMANLLVRPANYEQLLINRSTLLTALGYPLDDTLPYELGANALKLFKEYQDLYQIAGAYVTLARYSNYRGQYDQALNHLAAALEQVNYHHRTYYSSHHSTPDDLVTYQAEEGNPLSELDWMDEGVLTVPEWIARIREQLSVAYAGLGHKAASDYNRNIYLDILDLIRQDKELESRYAQLKKEELFINSLLSVLFLVILVAGVLFFWINRRYRQKAELYLLRLERSLEVCRKLTASFPSQSQTVDDILAPIVALIRQFLEQELQVQRIYLRIRLADAEEEIVHDTAPSLAQATDLRLNSFELNTTDSSLSSGLMRLFTPQKLTQEASSFVAILTPYLVWAIENGLNFLELGEERNILEKKLYIAHQHNQDQKRENILKRATMRVVYGIQPYLDRMHNEVYKLVFAEFTADAPIRQSKYQYLDELLETIQEYNKVLAYWIKIKQGDLNLQITNFELKELFELLEKGARSFEQKGITFTVVPTEVCVKADRALTLFMLNTLLENARKFTPEGGKVTVQAEAAKDYVELAVEDTGVGLAEEEQQLIRKEKVYDSATIGASDPKIKAQKGSGFGLMNCKAIMEKYRKLNPLFEVCTFDLTSEPGKGSRFYFRLPYGVRKTLLLLILFLGGWGITTPTYAAFTDGTEPHEFLVIDSLQVQWLEEVSDLADAAYFSNKDQLFEQSLAYINQAIHKLNSYYEQYSLYSAPLMSLTGRDVPAEKIWWQRGFDTNYYLILDLRNEAAVAYLALNDMDSYNYNNQAYTSLYMLISRDDSLDKTCKLMERSTSNKRMAFLLLIGVLVILLVAYYMIYIRRRLLRRWSLEQVLEINEGIFSSSLRFVHAKGHKLSETDLAAIPQSILTHSFAKINELKGIDGLGISMNNPEKNEFVTAYYPSSFTADSEAIKEAYATRKWVSRGAQLYIPLETTVERAWIGIGVFILQRRELKSVEEEKLFLGLIVRYLSTVLYHTLIRTAGRFQAINLVMDDIHRLEWENNQIHVQNRMLDNCLSAIKHETIYYPSRLKQVVNTLRTGDISPTGEQTELEGMYDLAAYYKGIFSILSMWAKEVLSQATFRRSNIEVADLVHTLKCQFKRRQSRIKSKLQLEVVAQENLQLTGDQKLIEYLFQLLLFDALAVDCAGTLKWTIQAEGEFIAFRMTDSRRDYTAQELNELFYPNLARIQTEPAQGLSGATYLLAKEIIREHDEFVGRRGCRIRANVHEEGGYTLYFTLNRKPQIIKNDERGKKI